MICNRICSRTNDGIDAVAPHHTGDGFTLDLVPLARVQAWDSWAQHNVPDVPDTEWTNHDRDAVHNAPEELQAELLDKSERIYNTPVPLPIAETNDDRAEWTRLAQVPLANISIAAEDIDSVIVHPNHLTIDNLSRPMVDIAARS